MFEHQLAAPLILVAVCVVVYWPTIFYLAIVDDIRWFDQVQKGLYRINKITYFRIYQWIKDRLYSGATWTRLSACGVCHGKRNISAYDEGKTKDIP